jgi:hypothetical protein
VGWVIVDETVDGIVVRLSNPRQVEDRHGR